MNASGVPGKMNDSRPKPLMVNDSLKESWRINTEINLNLLEHLNLEMLNTQPPGAGLSVAQHIVHMIDALISWGMFFDKPRFSSIPDLYEPKNEVLDPLKDVGVLRNVMKVSRELALEAAEAATDKGKLPYYSIETLLIHIIAHDAHHRGQIMLALKTAGFTLPSNNAIWSPWRTE